MLETSDISRTKGIKSLSALKEIEIWKWKLQPSFKTRLISNIVNIESILVNVFFDSCKLSAFIGSS